MRIDIAGIDRASKQLFRYVGFHLAEDLNELLMRSVNALAHLDLSERTNFRDGLVVQTDSSIKANFQFVDIHIIQILEMIHNYENRNRICIDSLNRLESQKPILLYLRSFGLEGPKTPALTSAIDRCYGDNLTTPVVYNPSELAIEFLVKKHFSDNFAIASLANLSAVADPRITSTVIKDQFQDLVERHEPAQRIRENSSGLPLLHCYDDQQWRRIIRELAGLCTGGIMVITHVTESIRFELRTLMEAGKQDRTHVFVILSKQETEETMRQQIHEGLGFDLYAVFDVTTISQIKTISDQDAREFCQKLLRGTTGPIKISAKQREAFAQCTVQFHESFPDSLRSCFEKVGRHLDVQLRDFFEIGWRLDDAASLAKLYEAFCFAQILYPSAIISGNRERAILSMVCLSVLNSHGPFALESSAILRRMGFGARRDLGAFYWQQAKLDLPRSTYTIEDAGFLYSAFIKSIASITS